MDKERILEKSREEHIDEGEIYILNESRKLGFKVFAGISSIFILFSLFFIKEKYTLYAIMSIFLGTHSTGHFYRYKFYKEKMQRVGFISSIIACIAFGFLFFGEVLWV